MRLQFVTSIPDFIEGRIINDIDPRSRQAIEWLRAGVAIALPSLDEETALAPETVERAVTRRGRATRKRKTLTAASLAEDD